MYNLETKNQEVERKKKKPGQSSREQEVRKKRHEKEV